MLVPSFVIYMIAMVGETNRAPFDLPEAEGELVGGFHTEYSSLKFALFFLAEYINMATVSALATTLFLGGWHAPWPISVWRAPTRATGRCCGSSARCSVFIFVFIWLRGSLPRLRYDQFMAFGWKRLIPSRWSGSWPWRPSAPSRSTAASIAPHPGRDRRAGGRLPGPVLIPEKRGDDDEADMASRRSAGGFPVPPMPAGGPVRGAAAPLTFREEN